jgi:hypothetical protein
VADSGSLRTIRWKRHKAGDHSLCRRCAAVRGEVPPPQPAADLDPAAEMAALAARLVAAHTADPANAILARELRMTLQAVPAREDAVDPFEELRAFAAKVS